MVLVLVWSKVVVGGFGCSGGDWLGLKWAGVSVAVGVGVRVCVNQSIHVGIFSRGPGLCGKFGQQLEHLNDVRL